MVIRQLLLSLVILACSATVFAADTHTAIFNDRVRSLQVRLVGNDFAPAVIGIDGNDRLMISFDHLAEERTYLRYSLTHCNADWQPSSMTEYEFVGGFNEASVDDYDYSRATTVHYIHYTIVIPDGDMRPLISGNYLLKVYPENFPDDIWLQCRFMVTEQTVAISASATSSTDIDYNAKHQQLSVSVDTEKAGVDDPFNDLIVVINQNGRLDNERVLRQPLRLSGRKAIYEHQPQLIFEAGNEYRRMETVSVNYPSMHVSAIEFIDPYYHITLDADEPRASRSYSYDSTQHGRFFIREYMSANSDTEADYTVVHFILDMPELDGASIFLDGDFVQHRFSPESRMVFNRATQRYEKAVLLKQGSYNYQYLALPFGENTASADKVEGNHYETVNEYTIKVYTRHRGERYDRLIGVSVISTAN